MQDKENNSDKEIWKELDRLTFLSSATAIIILTGLYFFVDSFVDSAPTLQAFLLGIITNFIPVFVLFAFSYLFLRRIETLRSEQETGILTMKIAESLKRIAAEKIASPSSNEENLDKNLYKDDFQQRKLKILFMSSNPVNTPTLQISNEIRAIKEALRKSKHGGSIELIQEIGIRKIDLQTYLMEHQPQVVHISTHADRDQLILEDSDGQSELVPILELNNIFSPFRDHLKLLLLNTEFTEKISEMTQNIYYVIAASTPVQDKDAIQFALAFYQAIANNYDVETAFNLAQAHIATRASYNISKSKRVSKRYKLLSNDGFVAQ